MLELNQLLILMHQKGEEMGCSEQIEAEEG